jgi:septum formation protein
MAGSRPPKLILASRSPQRRAILERVGVSFVVAPADVRELERGVPAEVALENALRKAQAVCQERSRAQAGIATSSTSSRQEIVLGVDTLVSMGGAIYGKPRDRDDARQTLAALSGARHEVISGMALLGPGALRRRALARTTVRFRELDEHILDWYLQTGEWRERAGGYAIQGAGAALVREVSGDYENVVGLPLASLLDVCPELLDVGRLACK